MKLVSTRNSGVKYFESHTLSLLRAFPFSQVQSAYAKGSLGVLGAGAAWVFSCGPTAGVAALLELDSTFAGAAPGVMFETPAAAVGVAAAGVAGLTEAGGTGVAFAVGAAGAFALDSSSATRFLSSTN